jgi:HTH-type transcriptional regulator / antitoxin HigA
MSVSTSQLTTAYLQSVAQETEGEIGPDTVLPAPKTFADYQRLVAVLNALIDDVGEDENDPWVEFMDRVGTLIEDFEDANIPELQES